LETFLGFGDYILWYPYELQDYCSWLLEFLGYDELRNLAYDLENTIKRMEADYLWGSFLLDVAYDVTRSPEPYPHGHRNLITAITHSQGVVLAIKDAAEGLFVSLHIDPNQLKKEQRQILEAMKEMGAISIDNRKTAAQIVKKAMNSSATEKYKEIMADLCHRGLASAKEGAGGGYWLTSVGRSITGKLNEAGVSIPVDETVVDAPATGKRSRSVAVASAAPAKRGASSPTTKDGQRRSESEGRSSKSAKENLERSTWKASRWVREFLRRNPGATEEEIVAHVREVAPHISGPEVRKTLKPGGDFKIVPKGGGGCGYIISDQ
jgi:hypothetical protein